METEIITPCDNVKPHNSAFDLSRLVFQNVAMSRNPDKPFFEQGRRLRWLRQAERISTGTEFAAKYDWGQSGYSQFETGKRRVPLDNVFDPHWLWDGEKRGLSFDLRQRIEAEEAKEMSQQLASGER